MAWYSLVIFWRTWSIARAVAFFCFSFHVGYLSFKVGYSIIPTLKFCLSIFETTFETFGFVIFSFAFPFSISIFEE